MKIRVIVILSVLLLFLSIDVKAASNMIDKDKADELATFFVYTYAAEENVDLDFKVNCEKTFLNSKGDETANYYTFSSLDGTKGGYIVISLDKKLPFDLEFAFDEHKYSIYDKVYYINSNTFFGTINEKLFYDGKICDINYMNETFEKYYEFRSNLIDNNPETVNETVEYNSNVLKLLERAEDPLNLNTLSLFDYIVYKDINANDSVYSIASKLGERSKYTVYYKTKCNTSYITPYLQGNYGSKYSLNTSSTAANSIYNESGGVCGKITAVTLIDYYNKKYSLNLGSGQDIYNELTNIYDTLTVCYPKAVTNIMKLINSGNVNNSHELILMHEIGMSLYFAKHGLFQYAKDIISNVKVQFGVFSSVSSFGSSAIIKDFLIAAANQLYKISNGKISIDLTKAKGIYSSVSDLVSAKLAIGEPVIAGGLTSVSSWFGGEDYLNNHYVTYVGQYKLKKTYKILFSRFTLYKDYIELYDNNTKDKSIIMDWLTYKNTALFYVTAI